MYSTAELAREARTTERGVRLWDMHNLLGDVQRDGHGARIFTEEHLKRAKIIATLQMWGRTLAEIKLIFAEKFPGNFVVSAIGDIRDFLDEVEAVAASDNQKVYDL